jgi:hypothetical protein
LRLAQIVDEALSANGSRRLVLNLKSLFYSMLRVAPLLALPALAACTTPEVCKELGSCGGEVVEASTDPTVLKTKTWNIAGACLNQEAAAPSVPSLIHQAPTLAGETAPHETQVNFCSEMVLKPDKTVKFVQPWFPALPLQSGLITYSSDGTFNASINYFGPQEMDFAAGCFQTQGFKIVPEGTLSTYDTLTCSEFTPLLLGGLATQPNIMDFGCYNDGAGGCTCSYNLLLITSISGKFTTVGHVINHYDTLANSPVSSADYCVNGDTLELSGYKRQFLFNQPALRSLVLSTGTSN